MPTSSNRSIAFRFPCKLIAFRSSHDISLTHIIVLHLIAIINTSIFEPMLRNQCLFLRMCWRTCLYKVQRYVTENCYPQVHISRRKVPLWYTQPNCVWKKYNRIVFGLVFKSLTLNFCAESRNENKEVMNNYSHHYHHHHHHHHHHHFIVLTTFRSS